MKYAERSMNVPNQKFQDNESIKTGNHFRKVACKILMTVGIINPTACNSNKNECKSGTHLCECIGSSTCDGDLICKEKVCINPPNQKLSAIKSEVTQTILEPPKKLETDHQEEDESRTNKRENLTVKVGQFNVDRRVLEKHRDLVGLILNSEEVKKAHEEQSWLNKLKHMSSNHIEKLKLILEDEKKQVTRRKRHKSGYCIYTSSIDACEPCRREADCGGSKYDTKSYCRASMTAKCKNIDSVIDEDSLDPESGESFALCRSHGGNDIYCWKLATEDY